MHSGGQKGRMRRRKSYLIDDDMVRRWEKQLFGYNQTEVHALKEKIMPRSLGGLDLQTTIAGHLQKMKFRIQEEDEWDHNNKIDFVVTKFPNYPKSVSLGIQITARCNDKQKLAEFVTKNEPSGGCITVADKALYLEIESNVDINRGGADLVASVLYSYQFDEQYADTKVFAAQILAKTDSLAYRFYDPHKNLATQTNTPIADLQSARNQLSKALGNGKIDLEGKFHSYFPEKGYGFILAQDGSTYFLHLAEVSDPALTRYLDSMKKLPGKAPLNYQVLFEDGGKTRNDTAYRTARNVRMLMKL